MSNILLVGLRINVVVTQKQKCTTFPYDLHFGAGLAYNRLSCHDFDSS
jgi:hypothetical protein